MTLRGIRIARYVTAGVQLFGIGVIGHGLFVAHGGTRTVLTSVSTVLCIMITAWTWHIWSGVEAHKREELRLKHLRATYTQVQRAIDLGDYKLAKTLWDKAEEAYEREHLSNPPADRGGV